MLNRSCVCILVFSLACFALIESRNIEGSEHSYVRNKRKLPDGVVPVNLYELLGTDAFATGITWQPMLCYAPTRQVIDGEDIQDKLKRLESLMLKDLIGALSQTTGAFEDQLHAGSSFPSVYGIPGFSQQLLYTNKPYKHSALRRLSSDPAYWRWLRAVSLVAAKYTVTGRQDVGPNRPWRMVCPNDTITALLSPNILGEGGVDCSNASSVLARTGLFMDASFTLQAIARRVLRDPGWCSVNPAYEPYGVWLKRERMVRRRRRQSSGGGESSDSTPFDSFDSPHKDRVVMLFDLLYESEQAAKRQRWMGTLTQQNPFDMYAITDIIHTLSPDLIIETGTGNGGSALMWASMLELTRPGSGRVITIDTQDPSAMAAKAAMAVLPGTPGRPKDPANNPLWSKYVTFLKGSSLDDRLVMTVSRAAAEARSVMVVLDSDRSMTHVASELRAYCPLVTNGSYCIVQGTRLSHRSAGVGGPAPAIRGFLASAAGDFVADRSREPFYSQHVGGYLQRVRPRAPGS